MEFKGDEALRRNLAVTGAVASCVRKTMNSLYRNDVEGMDSEALNRILGRCRLPGRHRRGVVVITATAVPIVIEIVVVAVADHRCHTRRSRYNMVA